MRTVFTFTLALFFLALSPSANAEKTFIDLDSAPGNFSVWKVSDLKANGVNFEATLVAVKKHETWAPTYSFKFGDGAGKTLNLKGSLLGGDRVTGSAVLSANDSTTNLENKLLVLPLGKEVLVSVSWSNGVISLSVGGVSQDFNAGFTPTEMQISSSTSELQVKDIVFSN